MSQFIIETTEPLGRIVVAPSLPPGTALFYTTRDFRGRLDDGIVRTLTTFIRERFGIETLLTTCNQVHGATVTAATRENAWRECDSCDALWSADRGVTLGIKVADCLPVTFIDPASGVVANIHSGWRGAVQLITAAAIDAAPIDAASTYAYLGPSIRACCFEVGEEVAEKFPEQFVDRTRAKPHVDIVAFTAGLLQSRGFAGERIFDSGLCTRCDGSIFHSYRRDARSGGRNLALVSQ